LARLGGFYKDPSFVLLLCLALLLGAGSGFRRVLQARSALGFGVVVAFVVPLVLCALGHYPVYYSWMALAPLSICVCAALSGADVGRSPRVRIVARGLFAGTCLAGLPLIFALSGVGWAGRDYARIERVVSEQVRHDDWVLADFPAYYAAKQRAAAVFLPTYGRVMTRLERERLTVLIVSPDELARVMRRLGGRWHPVADSSLGPATTGSASPSIWGRRYNFRIYRRG
jgi:hypothetical protein